MRDPVGEWLETIPGRLGGHTWRPAVDVYESDSALLLRFEIPGVPRDQIQIAVIRNEVRVRGVRRPRGDARSLRTHQVEIALGPFERAVTIGQPFERDRVSAKLEDGVLTITLPKQSARAIEVDA